MAHFMRVFTQSNEAPTIAELVKQIKQEGFEITTHPKEEDPRYTEAQWHSLHLSYSNHHQSLMLDRSIKGEEGSLMEEEIAEFGADLEAADQADNKSAVEAILQGASQIFACYIPDDIAEEGWELVEFLLEALLESTDGTLQVDGEGFFDKEGELLYAME